MSAITESSTNPDAEEAVRLRMGDGTALHYFDGGWWPQSRDLVREMRTLVRQFPLEHGQVRRALYCGPDWNSAPLLIDLGTRHLRVSSVGADDRHVLVVQTFSGKRLTLLVVPPDCTATQGEDALAAACTPDNTRSGSEVIMAVTRDLSAGPPEHVAAR